MTGTKFPPYIFDEEFEALLKKNTKHFTETAVAGTSKEDITVRAVHQSKMQYERNMLNYVCNSGFIGEERVFKLMELTGYSFDTAQEAVITYR